MKIDTRTSFIGTVRAENNRNSLHRKNKLVHTYLSLVLEIGSNIWAKCSFVDLQKYLKQQVAQPDLESETNLVLEACLFAFWPIIAAMGCILAKKGLASLCVNHVTHSSNLMNCLQWMYIMSIFHFIIISQTQFNECIFQWNRFPTTVHLRNNHRILIIILMALLFSTMPPLSLTPLVTKDKGIFQNWE